MFAPFPQNEVLVALSFSRRKTRDKDACCAAVNEPLSDSPGRGLPPLRDIREPGAGHIVERDASVFAIVFGSQIDDIFAIDVVLA